MNQLKKTFIPFLLPFALLLAAAAGAAGGVVGTESFTIPSWFKSSFLDIEDDAAEAHEQGRHLLVYFHLENCPYCAKMLGDSFADGTDNAPFIRAHFDSIDINIRGAREVSYRGDTLDERSFARAVNVQYTPTLLFIDAAGQAVLTVNGYRSPAALRQALQYVRDGAYRRQSLTTYNQRDASAAGRYTLRPHDNFSTITDLSSVQGPLMLLLEDDTCDECDWLHDNILDKTDVREQLEKMTVVRLDAKSEGMITTPAGKRQSAAAFARRLNLSYRPGVVFFENGKEIFRVTGLLNHYHFREAARYVAIGHRSAYPRFGAYLRARRQELIAAGETVDYSI